MLDVLVLVAMAEGKYTRDHLTEEAPALIPLTGDLRYLAGMYANLAMAHLALGRFAKAAYFARIGLGHGQELLMRCNIALHFDTLAVVAASHGEMAEAAQLFGAAEATRAREDQTPWHEADRALYGPAHAEARAALGEAAFASAWEAGRRHGPPNSARWRWPWKKARRSLLPRIRREDDETLIVMPRGRIEGATACNQVQVDRVRRAEDVH
jgi:hypothetical protein